MVTVDTTIFDGHLEALRGLRVAIERSIERLSAGRMRDEWTDLMETLRELEVDVECRSRNVCRNVATVWTIDGVFCEACAPEPETGPNEDADYEEAVGK